nr:MAG TPA: hypothetical protein [Caudoviricetes sp.]
MILTCSSHSTPNLRKWQRTRVVSSPLPSPVPFCMGPDD